MGYFITFEGGEGSGKTTIINEIEKHLKKKGLSIVLTRDPGGTKISEEIRKIILDNNNNAMNAKTEALLFAASRMQLLSEVIIPALKEDKVVLCDRFLDSSLVYQGIARDIGIDNILNINLFALKCLPDLTIFIDVKPEVGMKRLEKSNRKKDRLEVEEMVFHQKVYQGYKEVATLYKDRIISINGNKKIEEILIDVKKEIEKLVGFINV